MSLGAFALVVLLAACSTPRPSSAPSIAISCKDGSLAACPKDSKLVFKVNGLSGKFFFSAYIENGETHEQTWIAPNAEDDPMAMQIHPGEQILNRNVPLSVLGKGNFRVRALLTELPVTRKDVSGAKLQPTVDATASVTVTHAIGVPTTGQ